LAGLSSRQFGPLRHVTSATFISFFVLSSGRAHTCESPLNLDSLHRLRQGFAAITVDSVPLSFSRPSKLVNPASRPEQGAYKRNRTLNQRKLNQRNTREETQTQLVCGESFPRAPFLLKRKTRCPSLTVGLFDKGRGSLFGEEARCLGFSAILHISLLLKKEGGCVFISQP